MKSTIMALTIALALSGPFTAVHAVEKAAVPAGELQTVTLDVRKMDCPMCKITIRKALEKVPGVASAGVDYEAKTATVTFDPKQANLEALRYLEKIKLPELRRIGLRIQGAPRGA